MSNYNTKVTLVGKLKVKLDLPMDTVPKVYCRAFEDNMGVVEMCKLQPNEAYQYEVPPLP